MYDCRATIKTKDRKSGVGFAKGSSAFIACEVDGRVGNLRHMFIDSIVLSDGSRGTPFRLLVSFTTRVMRARALVKNHLTCKMSFNQFRLVISGVCKRGEMLCKADAGNWAFEACSALEKIKIRAREWKQWKALYGRGACTLAKNNKHKNMLCFQLRIMTQKIASSIVCSEAFPRSRSPRINIEVNPRWGSDA